jgi:DNA-directed RNA polymerase subunit omega
MARVTVEDCRPQIPSPFDLAMLAAERARQLSEGAPPAPSAKGGADGHKPAVTALREIAAGGLSVAALREAAVGRRQQAIVDAAPDAEDETPEPPPGDDFERRNEAAIAAGLEPLPVAGTGREPPGEDDEPAEQDRAA